MNQILKNYKISFNFHKNPSTPLRFPQGERWGIISLSETYKTRKFLPLFILSFLCTFHFMHSELPKNNILKYIDFDTSMRINDFQSSLYKNITKRRVGVDAQSAYDFFQQLYERNNFRTIKPQSTLKIPKIIHQIWIGKCVPPVFIAFRESWLACHPDWEYRLWTQKDIAHLNLKNRAYIEKTGNPGEKSDLMRYEILYQYGGVYIDMDFECLRSLDPLHYMYDFYIGIQPLDCEFVQLGIGIIGSVPRHPILKKCIDNIAQQWHNIGPEDVPERTGPIHFTKIFMEYVKKNDDTIDVALPAHYFYPLGCREFQLKKNDWQKMGSFGVHHWAKTWLTIPFRRPQFKTIKNY